MNVTASKQLLEYNTPCIMNNEQLAQLHTLYMYYRYETYILSRI